MIHGRSRAANRLTLLYRAPSSGRVPFRDNSDMCIAAAICNSIHLLGSSALASKYWNFLVSNITVFERSGILSRRICDFRDAAKHLRQDEVVLRGSGLPSPSLGALLGLSPGAYVATLEGLPHIMHSVCVSTIQHTVVDCMEEFPLQLRAASVKACVGEDGKFVGVSELRQVLLVTPSKKKRSRIGREDRRRAHKKAATRAQSSSTRR